MNILFAAPENAWGGFYHMIRKALPGHRFHATGGFRIDSLKGYHVLIPTMTSITATRTSGAATSCGPRSPWTSTEG